MYAWWVLVKVWGCLRLDDHRGLLPDQLQWSSFGLQGTPRADEDFRRRENKGYGFFLTNKHFRWLRRWKLGFGPQTGS